MNLKKIEFKEIRNYLVFGSGQFVNLLAPLLVAPYVISVCGIEQWGKIGAATSFFIILEIFIDFGSKLLGVKEISSNKENKNRVSEYLSTTYAFRLIVLLFILVCLVLALVLIPDLDLKLYLFGSWLLISQFFNPIWFYIGVENFKKINKIIMLSKAMYVLLVYVIVNQKSDYIYVIFLLGISNTIFYSYYYLKIFKEYKMSLQSVSKNKLIDSVKREYPIVISNLSISVYTNFPILIIKYILGDFYAGIYKIGDMFLGILRSYLVVFFNVSFPKFCHIYIENKKEAVAYLKKINIVNIIFLALIVTILYFMSFFFLNEFNLDKKLSNSLLFCTNFLFISLIIALNIPFYQMLILKNRQNKIARISFFGSLLMFVSCYFLSKNFNLQGSVISIYIVEIFITTSIIISSLSLFKKND
ncbi:O-antigen/teichoic acid export membrane protein [Flavobacterium sp. HSC-32F16]|uniref:lipopolysaccharide biosynthesis protein n=1 Tax=Flavobacterium sp. HSC-32F16 TaxID=2910964 RepID=UPI0020A23EE3|nr:oligosaccharide flippase family protein [Flavobacterium sp. HSC-32F16]MCP2026415.1 O-antigen/teichoic acid export membrane protein [Flavobacterium sp. HSC-32F16]